MCGACEGVRVGDRDPLLSTSGPGVAANAALLRPRFSQQATRLIKRLCSRHTY